MEGQKGDKVCESQIISLIRLNSISGGKPQLLGVQVLLQVWLGMDLTPIQESRIPDREF